MELWRELVKAALLGTERERSAPATTAGPLGEVVGRLNGTDAEGRLLAAAAVVWAYRRAGQGVAKADESQRTLPAEDEEWLRVSGRAGAQLGLMLGGEHGELLGEWLAAAASARKRAPEEWLPALLHAGKTQESLRDLVLAVAGERGRWLGAQNPEWGYASRGSFDEALWERGRLDERVAVLREVRRKDAGRGREWLAGVWEKESPDDRPKLVGCLAIGLGMDDEPLLESMLDDGRKEVRKAAANLLSLLAGSRLVKRMIERVEPLFEGSGGKRLRLAVKLPAACDAGMVRDGVERKPQGGYGERAWWLVQMLADVPPGVWAKKWGKAAGELVAAVQGEFAEEVWEGWGRAALRHRDAAWAEPILTAAVGRWTKDDSPVALDVLADLVGLMAARRREEWLIGLVKSGPAQAAALLGQSKFAWGERLTLEVLAYLQSQAAKADYQTFWRWSAVMKQAGTRMDPALAGDAAAGWPAEGKGWGLWKSGVEQMLAALQFRRDMLEAIKEA